MPFTFNLLDQPWIPCLSKECASPQLLGLRECMLRAHELRQIQGDTPLETFALHRLLLAMLHRALDGPNGYDHWGELWEAGYLAEDALNEYLDRWKHSFDLFDPQRPFYQKADDRARDKSAISLLHHLAKGNNPTLFDHHTESSGVTLTPAQAARTLLVVQNFSVAGLSGFREKFTDAPCTRGVNFLMTGNSLFETLLLNLLKNKPDSPNPLGFTNQSTDCPAWEMDDPFTTAAERPYGYLDYLTWQNRRVLLLPENIQGETVVRQMRWAPGLRLPADILEPFAAYLGDRDSGYKVVRFSPAKALWRDSAALLRLDSHFGAEAHSRPPQTFAWLAELADDDRLEYTQTLTCLALGMSTVPGQAKMLFYRAEQFSLPLLYLHERQLIGHLEQALDLSETVRSKLWGASNRMASLLLAPEADLSEGRSPDKKDCQQMIAHWNVAAHYWNRLETPFRELVEALPQQSEVAMDIWRQTLARSAWAAHDHAANQAGNEARALKATAHGRSQLAGGLRKVLYLQTETDKKETV